MLTELKLNRLHHCCQGVHDKINGGTNKQCKLCDNCGSLIMASLNQPYCHILVISLIHVITILLLHSYNQYSAHVIITFHLV